MADTLSKAERSERMSRIRGKDTKPELLLRRSLHALGFRFRLHVGALPGKPDIVLPKYRAVIFVHGCFWHRHPGGCNVANVPKSNVEFWIEKFRTNVRRDRRNKKALVADGWTVLTVWECQANTKGKAAVAAMDLMSALAAPEAY